MFLFIYFFLVPFSLRVHVEKQGTSDGVGCQGHTHAQHKHTDTQYTDMNTNTNTNKAASTCPHSISFLPVVHEETVIHFHSSPPLGLHFLDTLLILLCQLA